MEDYFVSYEQALRLKELGFDWKCDHFYDGNKRLLESSIFSHTYRVSDYWHNFNEYDRDNHRQSLYVSCSAPRLDQAAAWMREEKGWDVTPIPTLAEYGKKKYRWDICHWSNPEYGDSSQGIFDTYQDALSAGITKTIEILIT